MLVPKKQVKFDTSEKNPFVQKEKEKEKQKEQKNEVKNFVENYNYQEDNKQVQIKLKQGTSLCIY